MRVRAALLVLMVLVAGCSTPDPQVVTPPSGTTPPTEASPPPGNAAFALEHAFSGLDSPVLAAEVPDGSGHLVLVSQSGFVVRNPHVNGTSVPFLDLRDRVRAGGERGLLGFAFHPDYAENGVAFASYTDRDGDSVLARYRLAGDALDAAGEEVLLRVDQPYANHNGGHVVFGPDGYLYWGLGDGGSAGDPHGNGQNPDALLGSILRLDARPEGPIGVPPDNPFVGRDGADEVWAKGLRNPWRFSFDRETGDLWIGDVGQNGVEEVDYQPASSTGGEDYGWNVWEGNERYNAVGRTFSAPVAPVFTYPTDDGCAVTGGHVYRGPAAPSLAGAYVFADYCAGDLWTLRHVDGEWRRSVLLETDLRISSFAEDLDGDLYVVHHGGDVYRLVARG